MALAAHEHLRQTTIAKRRFPVGAEFVADGLVHFRLWAPAAQRVAVVLSEGASTRELASEGQGYLSELIEARAGDTYQLRIDHSTQLYPDPASRFQPRGPHRASEIIDARTYQWNDRDWPGIDLNDQVIYELHAGTFTREGTWASARAQLEELARFGVSVRWIRNSGCVAGGHLEHPTGEHDCVRTGTVPPAARRQGPTPYRMTRVDRRDLSWTGLDRS
jgi:1,4-alpha-glucan branching enzyme